MGVLRILFAGEGGQGVQAAAQILAEAAFAAEKKVTYIPNFGVEQRGGFSLAFIIVDSKLIAYPKFAKADILAAFSPASVERTKQYFDKKTKIVTLGQTDLPPRVWNIVILGKVNRLGKIIGEEELIKVMDRRFDRQFKKNPQLRELNIKALKG
jgi:2-oxoglutarate ferredoxin oxidoreductase subunit gamma